MCVWGGWVKFCSTRSHSIFRSLFVLLPWFQNIFRLSGIMPKCQFPWPGKVFQPQGEPWTPLKTTLRGHLMLASIGARNGNCTVDAAGQSHVWICLRRGHKHQAGGDSATELTENDNQPRSCSLSDASSPSLLDDNPADTAWKCFCAAAYVSASSLLWSCSFLKLSSSLRSSLSFPFREASSCQKKKKKLWTRTVSPTPLLCVNSEDCHWLRNIHLTAVCSTGLLSSVLLSKCRFCCWEHSWISLPPFVSRARHFPIFALLLLPPHLVSSSNSQLSRQAPCLFGRSEKNNSSCVCPWQSARRLYGTLDCQNRPSVNLHVVQDIPIWGEGAGEPLAFENLRSKIVQCQLTLEISHAG